jgi:hypothetical protein
MGNECSGLPMDSLMPNAYTLVLTLQPTKEEKRQFHPATATRCSRLAPSVLSDRRQDSCDSDWPRTRILSGSGPLTASVKRYFYSREHTCQHKMVVKAIAWD